MTATSAADWHESTGPIADAKGTEPVFEALARARESLFKQQRGDGHWLFPLEADASITAEYVIYRRMMELPVDSADRQAGERLLATQHVDGGWARYEGAPGQVSLAIEEFSGKKTIIIIAHRLSTVRKCNRLVFMKNGSIVDVGGFDALMEDNADFQRMVQASDNGGEDASSESLTPI